MKPRSLVAPVISIFILAALGGVTLAGAQTFSPYTIAAGSNPKAVGVNPATNKIYAANQGSNNLTIIDGVTNLTTPVNTGTAPGLIAINPVTDRIYVVNLGSNNVTVIDGATNATATLTVGNAPPFGYQPGDPRRLRDQRVLNNVSVVSQQQATSLPLQTKIAPLAGDTTAKATPSFNFTASSSFAPSAAHPTACCSR